MVKPKTSINNLTPSSIESLEFAILSIDEQNAITVILADMDVEIAALEAHREKARSLVKQGMMQQLLTGNIRLV